MPTHEGVEMPTPSVEPTPSEGKPPGRLDSDTFGLEYVASFTERIRIALDDLFDALYPDSDTEVRVDLVRVRADAVDAQFRKFEHSVQSCLKNRPPAQEGSA
jgi:hypothetical protein